MGVAINWDGLDEFRKALHDLPADLAQEARGSVVSTANDAAAALKAAYPAKTGNLRSKVKVVLDHQHATTSATVKSTAPHAHLWEFGTQVRRTQRGFNRGAEPAHFNQGLIGIAVRMRRRLQAQLIDIVKRAGFEVSGP